MAAQERQRILPAPKDQILYFQLLPQLAAAQAAALHPTAATAVLVAAGAGDSERAQAAQGIRLVHRQAKGQMAAAVMLVAAVVVALLPLAETPVVQQTEPLVEAELLHLFLAVPSLMLAAAVVAALLAAVRAALVAAVPEAVTRLIMVAQLEQLILAAAAVVAEISAATAARAAPAS